jgi:hypothetical protein
MFFWATAAELKHFWRRSDVRQWKTLLARPALFYRRRRRRAVKYNEEMGTTAIQSVGIYGHPSDYTLWDRAEQTDRIAELLNDQERGWQIGLYFDTLFSFCLIGEFCWNKLPGRNERKLVHFLGTLNRVVKLFFAARRRLLHSVRGQKERLIHRLLKGGIECFGKKGHILVVSVERKRERRERDFFQEKQDGPVKIATISKATRSSAQLSF